MESAITTAQKNNLDIQNQPSTLRDLLFLALGCAAIWGWTYGGWDFWGPDEPRYVQIARELLGRTNWLILTVMGQPYDQKPPLPYWMMAGMLKLNGGVVSSWVVRIPALLFGVMTVALTYLIGRSRLGRRVAWLGAWILLTSILFVEEVPTARLDTLLTGWIALAMWAWLGRADDAAPLPPWRAGLFWLGVTGAFFIKGPVAWLIVLGTAAVEAWIEGTSAARPRLGRFWVLVAAGGLLINLAAFIEKLRWLSPVGWLALAAALGLAIWQGRSWAGLRRLRPAFGLPFTIGAVVAWQAALRLTAPAENFKHQLQTATMDRLVNPSMHLRGAWYYLEKLFGDSLPVWSVVLAVALAGLWRMRRALPPEWPRLRPLLSWLLWPTLLLSIIPTKREQYLLPMYPAMALLIGWWLAGRLDRETVPKWLRRAAAGLAAVLGLVLIGAAVFLATGIGAKAFKFESEFVLLRGAPQFWARTAGLALAGALLIASAWAWPRVTRVRQAVVLFIASMVLAEAISLGCGAPIMNTRKSTRGVNAAIAAHVRGPGEEVGALGDTAKSTYQVYATHRIKDLNSSPNELKDHGAKAELPRIIIGEADDKKWKASYGVLKGFGYRPVYTASSDLERLTVLVREDRP